MEILMAPPPFRVYPGLLKPRKLPVLLRFPELRRLHLATLVKQKVTMRPLWEMLLALTSSPASPR